MKSHTLYIYLVLMFPLLLSAQNFNDNLKKLAEGISQKIKTTGKSKIAVWGFFTENGDRAKLGKFLTEDFSVYITNYGDNFEVIDRNHLNVLLKEHKLNADGYIDQSTAKELGKIIAVDAIITGTYTILHNEVRIRAKVLDTETARIFIADIASLPLNDNVSSYLGINPKGGNSVDRGFNSLLNSNETLNNPETVDPECKKKKIGDVCFANNLAEKVVVYFQYPNTKGEYYSNAYRLLTVDVNERKCSFGLANKPIRFFIAKWKDFVNPDKINNAASSIGHHTMTKWLKDKGEIKIGTCTSKTYTIK